MASVIASVDNKAEESGFGAINLLHLCKVVNVDKARSRCDVEIDAGGNVYTAYDCRIAGGRIVPDGRHRHEMIVTTSAELEGDDRHTHDINAFTNNSINHWHQILPEVDDIGVVGELGNATHVYLTTILPIMTPELT